MREHEGYIEAGSELGASLRIALGFSHIKAIHKVGSSSDLDKLEDRIMWPIKTDMTWQTADATLKVSSTSAADITPRVTVTYMKLGECIERTASVVLTGKTVATLLDSVTGAAATGFRINNSIVDKSCAGIVYVNHNDTVDAGGIPSTSTKIMDYIPIKYERSRTMAYTVPTGYFALIVEAIGICRTPATSGFDIHIYAKGVGDTAPPHFIHNITSFNAGSSMAERKPVVPEAFPAGTDIWMQMENATSDNMSVIGEWTILLHPADRIGLV